MYQRLRCEAQAELAGLGELEEEGEGEGEGDADADAELAGRIKDLEEKVAQLRAEEGVKEEIALGIVTAGDMQRVVYGVRSSSGGTGPGAVMGEDPSSVVMLRYKYIFLLPPRVLKYFLCLSTMLTSTL